jgi:hypothetical protein
VILLEDHRTLDKFPEIRVQIKYATEHRCGIVISAKDKFLTDLVTGTDPLKDEYHNL